MGVEAAVKVLERVLLVVAVAALLVMACVWLSVVAPMWALMLP